MSLTGQERETRLLETERIVMDVWRQVFNLETVSRDDDLIELGVSSLAAMTMCLRLEEIFKVEITPEKILFAPTVSQLAALIEETRA